MAVRATYPAGYTGDYLGTNFEEVRRYMKVFQQQGQGIWSVDQNEWSDIDLTRFQRAAIDLWGLKTAIGDAFKCVGTSAANDFTIKGGGGTLDTALRFYLKGLPCLIVSDTTYAGQNTPLNNGLASAPAALSPPGVGTRTDEIYLDIHLKEVKGNPSDTPLIPPSLTDSVSNRLRLITEVKVAVGPSTTPADFVDGSGIQHFTAKLATLNRFAAQAAINPPDIIDTRTVALSGAVTGGGALGLEVSRAEIDMLRPDPKNPTDNTVTVKAGTFTKNDSTGFKSVNDQTSPTFPVIGLAGNVRYDLLYIKNDGTLVRAAGTEILLAGSDPYLDSPNAAISDLAVAIAIIRVTETVTVVIDSTDITDVREFFNKGGGLGNPNMLTYSATALQTVFTAPNYVVGQNELLVFSGGFMMTSGQDYTETNSTTITFATGRVLGERVTIWRVGASGTPITLASAGQGFSMINGTLVATVAANALTIAVKTVGGGDPTALDPVYVIFRDPTPATGTYTVITLTAATSFVVSSGSTLGASSATAFRAWIVGFNDAGVFRLGVINCLNGTSIYPLGGFPIASSTAEGGAGAADSAHVFYTGTAVTAKPYAILGYASYETGLTVAGTWDATPTRLHLHRQGDPLPGATIQVQRTDTGAVATGSTAIPQDDTIPQITEGDQYMSQAITPSSASNLLRVASKAMVSPSGDDRGLAVALFRDAVANALTTSAYGNPGSTNEPGSTTVDFTVLAASVAATTFRIRAGSPTGTVTFNGELAGRLYGGTENSYLSVEEVMA